MRDLTHPDSVRDRSLRQWAANGLEQLILGLFFCATGGVYLLAHVLPLDWPIGRNYALVAPWLQLACILAMVTALRTLRARLIFPRTGYVVFRLEPWRKWVATAGVAATLTMGLIMILWASTLPDITTAMGPAFALVCAACFAWGGIRYGLRYAWWLGALSVGLGLWTFRTGAPVEWVMVSIGAGMAVAGGRLLDTFLKTHPIAGDHGE
jgi:hypothetical protein